MTWRLLGVTATILLAVTSVRAQAKDLTPCPAGMICASNPSTIVAALQKAGYKALLTTDNTGDPEVDSSADGYNYQILFWDCEAHQHCASIQIYTSFKASPKFTLAFANDWNRSERFLEATVLKDGGLALSHDITTIGGISQANFSDIVEWLNSTLQTFDKKLDAGGK